MFVDANDTSLTCPQITDQFAVSNNKAKLTYPVTMLTANEFRYINIDNTSDYSLTKTGKYYWLFSPGSYDSYRGVILLLLLLVNWVRWC